MLHRPRRGGALRAALPAAARIAVAAAAVVVFPVWAADPAAASTGPSSTTTATTVPMPAVKAAILVDVDTGRVLYEDNVHTPLPPGSLTKTLTAMIAADWLAPGTQLPVSALAANVYPDRVGMKPGQTWPLDTSLHALITDSANDAAYALAEDIGGSLAGFAPIMADAAQQIGMDDHPTLEDPAGLDGSDGFAGGNQISAWDLAVAGRDMMANPTLAAIAAEKTFDFTGPDGVQYHLLSRNYHFLASYPGAIGVKTGFTNRAGYCDMEEAEAGGRRMLAVVLGSTNPDAAAADLITAGFAIPVHREGASPSLPPVAEPRPPDPAPPPAAPPTTDPKLVQKVLKTGGPSVLVHGLEGAAAVVGLVLLTWIWRTRGNRR